MSGVRGLLAAVFALAVGGFLAAVIAGVADNGATWPATIGGLSIVGGLFSGGMLWELRGDGDDVAR